MKDFEIWQKLKRWDSQQIYIAMKAEIETMRREVDKIEKEKNMILYKYINSNDCLLNIFILIEELKFWNK